MIHVVRVLLCITLLYFIFHETGIATTIAIGLVFISFELRTHLDRQLIKEIKEERPDFFQSISRRSNQVE